MLSQVLLSLKRKEPKKTRHCSQSLVAFVNVICFVCSEKSLSLYFKSKDSFLCPWHFFFPYPVKESKPILWHFHTLLPYIILHFALWKAAQELLVNWQFIYFCKAQFISSFMISKIFLGGGWDGAIYFYSQSGWLCLSSKFHPVK